MRRTLEAAAALPPPEPRTRAAGSSSTRLRSGGAPIEELARLLKIEPARCVKTLIVEGTEDTVVALVVRGDHELNAVKAQSCPESQARCEWPARSAS